jgi:hypothetical protein
MSVQTTLALLSKEKMNTREANPRVGTGIYHTQTIVMKNVSRKDIM